MKTQDLTIDEVQKSIEDRQGQIRSRAINLRNFEVIGNRQFRVDGLDLYVPEKDDHPVKQLCSLISMSLGFYKANPSALNGQIFQTRLRDVQDTRVRDEKVRDDGSRMIRYRMSKDGSPHRLLAILPMNHQTLTYQEALRPILSALPDNVKLRLSNHDVVDDNHRFTMRASFPKFTTQIADKDPLEMGLYFDMSEDGLGPKMTLTSMLQRLVCSNGAMQTFDQHPYFEYNYRGIRPIDLGAAMTSAIDRFGQDLSFIHNQVLESSKVVMNKMQLEGFLRDLENHRTVSAGFIRKVRKELVARDIAHISRWDVVNEITQRAQGLPYSQRVQHEFVAGSLLGLNVKQVETPSPEQN